MVKMIMINLKPKEEVVINYIKDINKIMRKNTDT